MKLKNRIDIILVDDIDSKDKRIIQLELAKTCGGYSSYKGSRGYVMSDGQLVEESNTVYYANYGRLPRKEISRMRELIRVIAIMDRQETIGFAINGKLELVEGK